MSDLSDIFGGSQKYSIAEAEQLKEKLKCMSMFAKYTIGKLLVEDWKFNVSEKQRKLFPLEDWIKVQYNHYH